MQSTEAVFAYCIVNSRKAMFKSSPYGELRYQGIPLYRHFSTHYSVTSIFRNID